MNYLAIDTSGKNLTVVLNANGVLYTYDDKECGVNHSVALMPKIEELVEKANFDLKDVDFFACVVGAGSFTGIRIAVSTIKAFCVAYKKPCLSITSFDTLAYNKQGEKVLAIIDAKHDAFYVCGYDNNKVVYPPSYVDKQTLLSLKKEYAFLSNQEIDGIKTEKVDLLSGLINAVESKKDSANLDVESLVPLYVRKSQAEEGR